MHSKWFFGFLTLRFSEPEKLRARKQALGLTKKELQDLGVTKIPSSNNIKKRIENLESKQAAIVREKQELQKKQKTLEIIQQNFSALLASLEIGIPTQVKEEIL